MAELELGNIVFNTNKNQQYNCPDYVVALLRDIDRYLSRVMWNIEQKEYDSPFDNTANSFKNNVFEVQAYSWNDEVEQPYNFKWKDIEISWYKYIGRDVTVNKEFTPQHFIEMYNSCIASLLKWEHEVLKERDYNIIEKESNQVITTVNMDSGKFETVKYCPDCKYGFTDCINDEAYLKATHPNYYKKLKNSEGSSSCDICEDGSCYDDEDK